MYQAAVPGLGMGVSVPNWQIWAFVPEDKCDYLHPVINWITIQANHNSCSCVTVKMIDKQSIEADLRKVELIHNYNTCTVHYKRNDFWFNGAVRIS